MEAIQIQVIIFLCWFVTLKASPDDDALKEHNRLRKLHGAPPLTLSWSLSWEASARAEFLAEKKYLYLSDTKGKYGENLCFRLDDPEKCTQYWYNKIKNYDFNNPGFSITTAEFTQLVWAASTELGWGQAQANNSFYYVVARYTPSGNVGSYVRNVPRLLSDRNPTSDSATGRIAVKAMTISISLGLLKLIY